MTLRKRVDELTDSVERINAINQQLGGRLKLYQRLLDRAMQGLEPLVTASAVSQENANQLGIGSEWKEAQQTLADIRKQLDGGGK